MITRIHLFLFCLLSFLGTACDRSNDPPNDGGLVDFSDGILIGTQGQVPTTNSAIFHLDRQTGKIVQVPISFPSGQKIPAGLSDLVSDGKNYWILAGNSKSINLVSSDDFTFQQNIPGFNKPSHVCFSGSHAFVTDDFPGDGRIRMLDKASGMLIATIPLNFAPREITTNGKQVFASGYLSQDSTIAILDTLTLGIQYINVGIVPFSMDWDSNGKLWFLCKGDYRNLQDSSTWKKGSIGRVNPFWPSLEVSLQFDTLVQPDDICTDPSGPNIFYAAGGKIYKISNEPSGLPVDPYVNSSKYFSVISIDPVTREIYGLEKPSPGSGSSTGWLVRFDSYGIKIGEYPIGNFPVFTLAQ